MARPRNPDRDRAFEIWRNSGGTAKLKDIADQIGVPASRIRKWKTEDKWEEKIKERSDSNKGALLNSNRSAPKRRGPPLGSKNAFGHGAPKGNKNAAGNRGGPGGPVGNKKALTTGEYETIWLDCLTEEEQVLYQGMNTDTLAQVDEDIRLLTVRERRMLKKIQSITNGMTEKERKVLQERINEKVPVEVVHEVTGEKKIVNVNNPKMITTEISETEFRKIDDILKIEEALTRVQEKKTRLLTLKHTIEAAEHSNEGADAAQDHAKRVQEAWANR